MRNWINLFEYSDRSIVNSRGGVLASTPEAVERFWVWFGKSKVKNKAGQPIVCFHGTTGLFRAFDPEMSNRHTQTGVPHSTFAFTDHPDVAVSYITDKADNMEFATPELADEFRRLMKTGSFDDQMNFLYDHPKVNRPVYDDGGHVMPVYLKLLKPLIVNAKGYHWHDIYFKPKDYRVPESFTTNELAEYAQDNGYDGLIIRKVKDVHAGEDHLSTVYYAFSPNQIKSAIANNGMFSTGNEIDEDTQ